MSSDTIDLKQKLLIEYMISSKEVFARCYKILKPSYFTPPLDRVVEVVMEFFVNHKNAPSVEIIQAETGVLLASRVIEQHEIDYLLEEIEEHCQTEAMAQAILAGADLVAEGNRGGIDALVREALLVRLDSDLGLDFFEDPEERIRIMDQNVVNYTSGIPILDELVGGLHKGELGVIYAASSGGKSLMMSNMAIALAKQQLDVCIISLELNELLNAKRMDVMLTGEDIRKHGDNANTIAQKIADERERHNMGKITIKQMVASKTTASTIRAYLTEYSIIHGKFPDAVFVDYLRLMGVDRGVRENVSEQDNEKSIELRAIAVELDILMVSAGQIGREGQDTVDISPSQISGGMVVLNNSDWAIALAASEEDIENSSVRMKALKQRNATKNASLHTLYRCPKSLRFSSEPFIEAKIGTSPIVKKLEKKLAAKGEEGLKANPNPRPTKKKEEKPEISNITAKTGRDKLRAALKL